MIDPAAGFRQESDVATRIVHRVAFAIGVGALGVSVGLGLAQALGRSGRLPPLLVDPLVEAQREYAREDPERWIAEARSLTEIQPRNQGAYLALARGLAAAGRVDDAIGAYERARALGSLPPIAHAQLARLHHLRGDLDLARDQADAALRQGITLPDEFLRAIGLVAEPVEAR